MALPATRGLPIPPSPVMPPEGLAPVTQEVGLGAGDDAMSPTTMVLNYLKARGYTPSSENVRRALEANQRDPGVISGLRSDRPATDAEDQAAMAAARGGARSGAGGLPVPPIPPNPERPGNETPTSGSPDTSTPPPGGIGPGGSLAGSIINGIPLALAGGAGAYGMYRAAQNMQRPTPDANISLPPTMPPAPTDPMRGPGIVDYTPQPGFPSTPMPTPESRPGQIDYTQLTPPSPAANPMEAALNRAVPSEAPPITPMRPAGTPITPAARPPSSAQDVVDAAQLAVGRGTAPQVPVRPRGGARVTPRLRL